MATSAPSVVPPATPGPPAVLAEAPPTPTASGAGSRRSGAGSFSAAARARRRWQPQTGWPRTPQ
eukprot:610402-Alexandrium_andersonii.AAC.1